jgi:hypothetical protein
MPQGRTTPQHNPRRGHSSIGYLSPIDYERQNQTASVAAGAHHPAAVLAAVEDKPSGGRRPVHPTTNDERAL